MSPSVALERLIQPPETRAQIQTVVMAFLPIAGRMLSIIEKNNHPNMDDLGKTLPGIMELCRDIIDGVDVDEAWHPTADERPKITPYPVYAALLTIGEQVSLNSELTSILANAFIAIWGGVPEAPGGQVPLSNLQKVFLEFRRAHLWMDGLESVDTSEPENCYTTLDQLEQRLRERGDLRAGHLSPIRRLLGLSLQKESLIERRARAEIEGSADTDEYENRADSDFEMERIPIDAEASDESDSAALIECFSFPIRTIGDQDKIFQTAERNALPSDDLVHL